MSGLAATLGLIVSVAGLLLGIPLLWRYGERRRAVAYGVAVLIAPHLLAFPARVEEGTLRTVLIYGVAALLPVYLLLGWSALGDVHGAVHREPATPMAPAELLRHGWIALGVAAIVSGQYVDAADRAAPAPVSFLLGAILLATTGAVLLWEAKATP
jgi:hypothetical protein